MAAKQQHSDGKRWCEEQTEIPADRGRDTHVVQPTSQNREWQYEDLEKIQTCPPPHSAGEGKKRLQPHGREDLGGEHKEESKSHHCHHGHPAAGKRLSSLTAGVQIECECFSQNG